MAVQPASAGTLHPPTRLQCALCNAIFSNRQEPADLSEQWELAEEPLDEAGIAELTRIAEATVEDERARGRQLDAKSTSLAGFSGLILAIETALSRSIFGVDLGATGNVVARFGLVVSAVAMLSAVAIAIAGVMMPQGYRQLSLAQIDAFRGPDMQATEVTALRRSLLQALAITLAQDRPVNDCKARLTKGVAWFLLAGFVALAVSAVTIAEHSVLH